MAICEKCNQDASELLGRSNLEGGKRMCRPCYERAEKAQREADPEEVARRAQIAAEMEKQREGQREAERRAPNPDYCCAIHSRHGRATILAHGLLLCEECARSFASTFDPSLGDTPWSGEPIVLALERRVAELEAKIAALEAAHAETPTAARKAVRS